MTYDHPPNQDSGSAPDPGRQPGQKHGREPEPPSVTDSEFEVRFQQALEKVTALVMNLPLGEVGSTTPGTFGAIEYTLANQITELTERAIRLERAARTIEAAQTQVLGSIPRAFENQSVDADTTHTGLLSAANQIAAATRTSDQTIGSQLNAAYEISEHFPELIQFMSSGDLSFQHAKHIADQGSHLPEEVRSDYFDRAVKIATRTTAGRLKRRLPKLVAALAPETVELQHEQACRQRRVWVSDAGNGMAILGALLPAPIALAAYDRVTRMAKHATVETSAADTETTDFEFESPDQNIAVNSVRDARTLAEARADVVSELLLAASSARGIEENGVPFGREILGKVQVTIPVTTLIGENDDTRRETRDSEMKPAGTRYGDLAGYGIIDAKIARWFAADAKSWDRIFLDETGTIVATDSYVPTSAIRRIVTARDGHCRFPGCLTPPTRCDIDHTHDWAKGGTTSTDNLALLCRKHHTLKHPGLHDIARWSVKQKPGGILIWTDPSGREYTEVPSPTIEPDGERSAVSKKKSVAWGQVDPDAAPVTDEDRPF